MPTPEFTTTRWTFVVSAGHESSPDAAQALAWLCERYWLPLYAYVRRRVPDVHEAQDLTQGFFAELLEKQRIGAADPDRGRFRSFLLTSLKNYLSHQREKEQAQKRGGGTRPLSLDFESADTTLQIQPATELTPEQIYEQQWALALLGRIMESLEREFSEAGKANQFAELKGFVIGEHPGVTYAMAAEKLGLTEAAAKQTASRMRKRYRALLREEIAQTISSPEEIDDEIRNLFLILKK